MPTKVGNGGHSQENYDPSTGRYVKSEVSTNQYIKSTSRIDFDWDEIEDEFSNIDFNSTDEASNNNDYEELKNYIRNNITLYGNVSKKSLEKLLDNISQADEKMVSRVNNFFKTDFGKSIHIELHKNGSSYGIEKSTYWMPLQRIISLQDTNSPGTFFHEIGHVMNTYLSNQRNEGIFQVATAKYNSILENIRTIEKKENFFGIDNLMNDLSSTFNEPKIKYLYDCYKAIYLKETKGTPIPNDVSENYVNNGCSSFKKENRELLSGVSDFISSLTYNDFNVGYCHSKSYWRKDANNSLDEFFANMNAYSATKQKNVIECIRRHYPELVNVYDTVIKDIDETF